jgi:hypothetical protein
LEERSHGVVVDRLSDWFHVYQGTGGSHTFVDVMTDLCRNFGVPETVTSDGGPHFTSLATLDFFRQYGIHHRRTSVGNPHANSRAEIAVKTAKRLLRDNTSISGGLNTVRVTQALLSHRNTPDRDTGLSPAYMLLGRQLKEFLPSRTPLRDVNDMSQLWKNVANWRELALAKRSAADQEKWSRQTRQPPPLTTGDDVMVQNMTGNHPSKWDKRGRIVKVLPFDQFEVMVDGSRRLTLRNRKHLRKFSPINGSYTPSRGSTHTPVWPAQHSITPVDSTTLADNATPLTDQQRYKVDTPPCPNFNQDACIRTGQLHAPETVPERTETTSPGDVEPISTLPTPASPQPRQPEPPRTEEKEANVPASTFKEAKPHPLATSDTQSRPRRSTRSNKGVTSKYRDFYRSRLLFADQEGASATRRGPASASLSRGHSLG